MCFTGYTGEDRLHPSLTVSGFLRLEAHLCFADTHRQDRQVNVKKKFNPVHALYATCIRHQTPAGGTKDYHSDKCNHPSIYLGHCYGVGDTGRVHETPTQVTSLLQATGTTHTQWRHFQYLQFTRLHVFDLWESQ